MRWGVGGSPSTAMGATCHSEDAFFWLWVCEWPAQLADTVQSRDTKCPLVVTAEFY